jgi:hypothetical protein
MFDSPAQQKGEAQQLLDKEARAKQFYKNANYMSASGTDGLGCFPYPALTLFVFSQHFRLFQKN